MKLDSLTLEHAIYSTPLEVCTDTIDMSMCEFFLPRKNSILQVYFIFSRVIISYSVVSRLQRNIIAVNPPKCK